MAHRQRDLDQACDASGTLQMPDVRLHRADQQGVARISALSIDRCRGMHFDRIPEFRPCSVRFEIIHTRRARFRPCESFLDYALLGRPVRHCQPRAGPVLIYCGAPDHPPDPVSGCLGVAQSLQDNDSAPLAAHVAIRCGVKGLAATVRREHASFPEGIGYHWREDGAHPSGEDQIRLVALQRGRCLVYRD